MKFKLRVALLQYVEASHVKKKRRKRDRFEYKDVGIRFEIIALLPVALSIVQGLHFALVYEKLHRFAWSGVVNYFFSLSNVLCIRALEEVKISQWNVDLLLSCILLVSDVERRAGMHNGAALHLTFRQLVHQPNNAAGVDDVSSNTKYFRSKNIGWALTSLLCNYLWFIIVSLLFIDVGLWLKRRSLRQNEKENRLLSSNWGNRYRQRKSQDGVEVMGTMWIFECEMCFSAFLMFMQVTMHKPSLNLHLTSSTSQELNKNESTRFSDRVDFRLCRRFVAGKYAQINHNNISKKIHTRSL